MITETKKYLQVKDLNFRTLTPEMFNECSYKLTDPQLEFVDIDSIIKKGNFKNFIAELSYTIGVNYQNKFNKFSPDFVLDNDNMNYLLANIYDGVEALMFMTDHYAYDVDNWEKICKEYKLNNAYFELNDYYDLKESIEKHKPCGFFDSLNYNEEYKEKYKINKEGIDKLNEYINDETLDFDKILNKLNIDLKGFLSEKELKENKEIYKADMEESIKEKMPVNSIKGLLEQLDDDNSLWGIKTKSNILYNINNKCKRK